MNVENFGHCELYAIIFHDAMLVRSRPPVRVDVVIWLVPEKDFTRIEEPLLLMGKLSLLLGPTAKMGQEFHKLIGAEYGYSIG